jgi:hypothetical protein
MGSAVAELKLHSQPWELAGRGREEEGVGRRGAGEEAAACCMERRKVAPWAGWRGAWPCSLPACFWCAYLVLLLREEEEKENREKRKKEKGRKKKKMGKWEKISNLKISNEKIKDNYGVGLKIIFVKQRNTPN